MPLDRGTRFGPYEIIAPLGAGGMGEVYRARDSKLGREIALKVLPAALAEDAGRMARFEREAQVLASVNHPNIAAIYGIETGAIVMELVEGDDLKGPVSIETALNYARQIAAALEAAHEKGIVHRDLKPANIKVTPDGAIKLLDFGLAKADDPKPSTAGANPTMSPTLSLAMTEAGMILGTAGYMAPEQARGKAVDKRADIWAFGVVLYELLAGRMLFGGGETVTDMLAAIITKEPDWSSLPADTPPRVRRLLDRCLRKDPKTRLRDIGEARVILDEAEPAPGAALTTQPPRRAWLPWAIAGLAVLAAGVTGGASWLRPKTPGTGIVAARFLLPLPEGTTEAQFTAGPQAVPSPDGRYVAFVPLDASGTSSLWLRPLGSVAAQRLKGTEGANFPFWSPDAQFIAFFADNKLKKVAVSGGSPQTICDAAPSFGASLGSGDGGTWNEQGVIVFSPGRGKPLMQVAAAGGAPTAVTSLEQTGDRAHLWPQFLPDGRHVLYVVSAADAAKSAVYVQELGSSNRVLVMTSPLRAVPAPPDQLLFIREGTLFAQHMDPKTFRLEGEPLPLAQEVSNNEGNGRTAFSVSGNGVLVYRTGALARFKQLTWSDSNGRRLGVLGQSGEYWSVTISPDQKSAAVVAAPASKRDLWIMDLNSGAFTRATRDQNLAASPVAWSPDSQRIGLTTNRGEVNELEVASGKLAPLTSGSTVTDWSPDSRSLVCLDGLGVRLSLFPLGGAAQLQTVLTFPYRTSSFRFSPDGRFVAYASEESGQQEVFVASFPSFSVKRRISLAGGSNPVWKKDGKELFFREPPGTVMSSEIRTGPTIEAAVPKKLFSYGDNSPYGRTFGVTADGKRFLVLDPDLKVTRPSETVVVLNWLADLK